LTAADALRSFPGSAIVQQGGVGLLRRLLLSEKGATTPARQVIVTEGLMPLVVAAMETHPELATLQVRNAIFVPFAYPFHTLKTRSFLPRQARDKHTENSKERMAFRIERGAVDDDADGDPRHHC
jgi:hypothetical protein